MLKATNNQSQILSITLDSMINRLQPVESFLEKNIESPAEQVTLIVHSSVLISQNFAYSMSIIYKSASLQCAIELQQSHGRDRCAR